MANETLIVIPVRAGSVGIPHKATRLLGGVSPLVRTIRTAQQTGQTVLVTTTDARLSEVARGEGAIVVHESPSLNPDGSRSLDAAVHAVVEPYPWPAQTVVTLQATCPFTTVETVRRCIQLSQELDCSVLTVRDDRALRWTMTPNEPHLTDRAPARVIRQHMPPTWRETGAVFATPRRYVISDYRFAPTTYLLPVTGAEAIDLDAPEDWAVAEWYAGAPSTRECLMARVLADQRPPDSPSNLIIQLSAWDEETDDTSFRDATLRNLSGELLQPRGTNTREEAQMCAGAVKRVRDVLLLTSAYHQPRAFLTFLKVLQQHHWAQRVRLWNVPAASRMDKLPAEWQKITAYQTKGHVASLEDGLTHLDWRDRQVACLAT